MKVTNTMRWLTLTLLTMATIATTTAQSICKRCKHSVTTPIAQAAVIGAKRAGVPAEVKAIEGLIAREHGWGTPSRFAKNKHSTAYGLGQFIDATWKSVGIAKTSCQVCQIEGIYRYVKYHKTYGYNKRKKVFGTVAKAVQVWDSRATTLYRHGVRRPWGGTY
jgi:hypothetical protein